MPESMLDAKSLSYSLIGKAAEGFEPVGQFYKNNPTALNIIWGGTVYPLIVFRDDIVHGVWHLDEQGNVVGERSRKQFVYTPEELALRAEQFWRFANDIGSTPEERAEMRLEVHASIARPTQTIPVEVSNDPRGVDRLLKKYPDAKGEWMEFPSEHERFVFALLIPNVTVAIYLDMYSVLCRSCNAENEHPVKTVIDGVNVRRRNDSWNYVFQHVLSSSAKTIAPHIKHSNSRSHKRRQKHGR